jgi:hypothetical protein
MSPLASRQRETGRALDGTVNDVVLTLCGGTSPIRGSGYRLCRARCARRSNVPSWHRIIYGDALDFGVMTDASKTPDAGVITAKLRTSLDEVVAAASPPRRSR